MAEPISIQQLKDASLDVKSLEEVVNGDENTVVTTRLGETYPSIKSVLDKTILSSGYIVVASFGDGATLTERNQALIDSSGNIYRWGGVLPKTVPSGATPETTGGFAKNAWVAVGDAVIEQSVDALKKSDRLGTSNYHYTQMGKAFDSADGAGDPFASWLHANIAYDETVDKFVIFYNTNNGHVISQNSVLMRTKSVEGEDFSAPIVVANDRLNFSYKTQASGIAKNGDYLSLVARFPWGNNTSNATFVYRSTDRGVTFTRSEMKHNGSAITAFNGDVSGFLVTQSGRILTFANHPTSLLCRIYYSDDNGITWNLSSIGSNPSNISEPAWCDLGGGKLICLARASIVTGTIDETIPAKFMTSIDDGATWTTPVDSKSITNLTLANGTLLPDYERKTVEFIHHSRRTDSDNYCSLLRSWATLDDAFNDKFKPQVRIGKMAAYTKLEDSTGDSGYVGAAKSKSGVINAFYYTGKRISAQISWVVGLPNTTYNTAKNIDYKTGEVNKIPKFAPYPLYFAGDLNVNQPVVFSSSAGTYDIHTDNVELKHPAITDNIARESRFFLSRALDLSTVDYISINIKSLTTPDYAAGVPSLTVMLRAYTEEPTPRETLAQIATDSNGVLILDTRSVKQRARIGVTLASKHTSPSSCVIDTIMAHDSVSTKPFLPLPFKNIFWKNGLGYLGRDGITEKKFGSGTAVITSTGSELTQKVVSVVPSTTNSIIIFNNAIPSGVKYIALKILASSALTVPDTIYVGVRSSLNPTTEAEGEILTSVVRGTDNGIFLDLTKASIPPSSYLFIRFRTAQTVENTAYINDVVAYY